MTRDEVLERLDRMASFWEESDAREGVKNGPYATALRAAAEIIRASGWRPIAEAPNGEKLVVGRRLESKRWVMACLYKYEAVSMFYTHYYPIAAPPQEGE